MQAIATETFQGLSGASIWLTLLHSLWLGLAVAALVSLIFQAGMTLSHRARHATLLVALGLVAVGSPVLALIPPLTIWGPSVGVPLATAEALMVSPPSPGVPSRGAASALESGSTEQMTSSPLLFRALAVMLERTAFVMRRVRPIALTVWSLSVLALTLVLALGVRSLGRLCRDACPAPQAVRKRAERLGRLLRLRTFPEIRVHATLGEPCLCGVFRPVILLPGRWLATAGSESIDAVLAHELAHTRRCDHLLNLAQRMMEAFLFFHPGVHWLSRSLRRQSELCADSLAVRLTGDPLALARALESVARLRLASPMPSTAGVTLGGEHSSLLPRIQELIGMTPVRTRLQAWPFVALPSAVIIALVAASVGLAPDEPSSSPTPSRPSVDVPQVAGLRRVVSAPAPAISRADSNRQISFEVRFIDDESDSWRDHLEGRQKALEQESGISGWVIDRPALMSLLKSMQEEGSANLLQAPKVTTIEGALAFVSTRRPSTHASTRPPGTDSVKGEKRRTRDGRGVAQEIVEGTEIKFLGSGLNGGTRISVDLSDSWFVPGQDEVASHPEAGSPHKARVSTAARHIESLEVPEGSSLAFSLGRRVRTVGSKSVMCDRLIVITPRRIVLESEEQPVVKATERQGKAHKPLTR